MLARLELQARVSTRPADEPVMKTHVLVVAVLGLAVMFCGTACADAIPFAYSGPGVSVAGTFFGSNNSDGSWTITGIDATYNQIEVSGIVATGLDPRFLYNNLYYDSGYADYAVDYLGIVFAVPGVGEVNLCSYTPRAAAEAVVMPPFCGTAATISSRKSASQTLDRPYRSPPH
jgi:hypothetical protein